VSPWQRPFSARRGTAGSVLATGRRGGPRACGGLEVPSRPCLWRPRAQWACWRAQRGAPACRAEGFLSGAAARRRGAASRRFSQKAAVGARSSSCLRGVTSAPWGAPLGGRMAAFPGLAPSATLAAQAAHMPPQAGTCLHTRTREGEGRIFSRYAYIGWSAWALLRERSPAEIEHPTQGNCTTPP
jgi:hypothetical protein